MALWAMGLANQLRGIDFDTSKAVAIWDKLRLTGADVGFASPAPGGRGASRRARTLARGDEARQARGPDETPRGSEDGPRAAGTTYDEGDETGDETAIARSQSTS